MCAIPRYMPNKFHVIFYFHFSSSVFYIVFPTFGWVFPGFHSVWAKIYLRVVSLLVFYFLFHSNRFIMWHVCWQRFFSSFSFLFYFALYEKSWKNAYDILLSLRFCVPLHSVCVYNVFFISLFFGTISYQCIWQ